MDTGVWEDIKCLEKWHRRLMAAGVCYDVYSSYAECMRRGLASWVQQNHAVYTEDVMAAENYHDNGTWSRCLNGYKWFVMGGQGAGLFFDDGGPSPGYINFWLNVNDELRQAVEKEAYLVATICTANHGVSSDDLGGWEGRYAEAEFDEVFGEASRNARELVVKWAAKEYDNAINTPPAPAKSNSPAPAKSKEEVCVAVAKCILHNKQKGMQRPAAIEKAIADNIADITALGLWRLNKGRPDEGEPGSSWKACYQTLYDKGYLKQQ